MPLDKVRLYQHQPLARIFTTSAIFACVTLCALMITTKLAHAWDYQVTNEVKPGQKAKILITPPLELKRVVVTLNSPRAKSITKRFKRWPAGRAQRIQFRPPLGRSAWTAEIKGMTPRGEMNVNLEFEIVSSKPLKVQLLNQESSMREGRIVFKSAQPLARVEAQAYGDEGELQWEEALKVERQGAKHIATFKREVTPRRLELKIYNEAQAWMSFTVVHWYAEVPHEDVNFASGSSEVSANELPKIKAAVEGVTEEIAKFRRAMGDPNAPVDLELYVGGYTDTVGSARDNLKLSQARARAICVALRRLGVTLKIRYAGFGERGQLVKTPDSTPEPRNRRAVYVIANAAPSGSFFPNARWRTAR